MRPVVIAKALVLVLLGIYLALGLGAAPKQACSTPVPPSGEARLRQRQGRLRALQCRNPHTE